MNKPIWLLALILSSIASYGQSITEATKDSLKTVICNMTRDDQKHRTQQEVKDGQDVLDSINFFQLVAITKKFGFPDSKRIGSNCNASPFIILLHNPYRVARKENYELLMSEYKKGNLSGWELGQAIDRFCILHHKKSLYGLYPAKKPCIEDIELVNKNRKELGLIELKQENFSTCR